MKKYAIVAGLLTAFLAIAAAQQAVPDAQSIGVDSAQQKLKEISINKFEDPGFWKVSVPLDQAVVTVRSFEASAQDKKPIADDGTGGIVEPDKKVLGVKTEFYGRTTTTISIEPSRPLAVPGVTKLISLWVVGRNFNHVLKVVIEDQYGHRSVLPFGKLNFSGWKKLTVAVPPYLVQRDSHYSNRTGIKILGFVVEPELSETYGTYYVYLDDLRVTTDLFAEDNRDKDDVPDNW